MVDLLAEKLSERFAEAAAMSLIAILGLDAAYEQANRLAATVEEDAREMYVDIIAALEKAMGVQTAELHAGR